MGSITKKTEKKSTTGIDGSLIPDFTGNEDSKTNQPLSMNTGRSIYWAQPPVLHQAVQGLTQPVEYGRPPSVEAVLAQQAADGHRHYQSGFCGAAVVHSKCCHCYAIDIKVSLYI